MENISLFSSLAANEDQQLKESEATFNLTGRHHHQYHRYHCYNHQYHLIIVIIIDVILIIVINMITISDHTRRLSCFAIA